MSPFWVAPGKSHQMALNRAGKTPAVRIGPSKRHLHGNHKSALEFDIFDGQSMLILYDVDNNRLGLQRDREGYTVGGTGNTKRAWRLTIPEEFREKVRPGLYAIKRAEPDDAPVELVIDLEREITEKPESQVPVIPEPEIPA